MELRPGWFTWQWPLDRPTPLTGNAYIDLDGQGRRRQHCAGNTPRDNTRASHAGSAHGSSDHDTNAHRLPDHEPESQRGARLVQWALPSDLYLHWSDFRSG